VRRLGIGGDFGQGTREGVLRGRRGGREKHDLHMTAVRDLGGAHEGLARGARRVLQSDGCGVGAVPLFEQSGKAFDIELARVKPRAPGASPVPVTGGGGS